MSDPTHPVLTINSLDYVAIVAKISVCIEGVLGIWLGTFMRSGLQIDPPHPVPVNKLS